MPVVWYQLVGIRQNLTLYLYVPFEAKDDALKEVVYRIPLRQLTDNLTEQQITQVSRSTVVNSEKITGIDRTEQSVILMHRYKVLVSKKY